MLARLQPSKWQITETYTYKHTVGTQKHIEHTGSSGEVFIRIPYDAAECSDLVPKQDESGLGAGQNSNDPVTVGFLSIGGAPNARPIALRVENPQHSLARVDIFSKSYAFDVGEPPPVTLRVDAKIIDEPKGEIPVSEFFEVHEFADGLNLTLRLTVSIPVDKLLAPASLQRHLRQILSGQRQENCVRVAPDHEPSRDAIGRGLSTLANGGGGILLFGVSEAGAVMGVEEATLAELTGLAESEALAMDPPLAINPPAHFMVEGKHLLIVEIPKSITEDALRRKALFYWRGKPYFSANSGVAARATVDGQALDETGVVRFSAYDLRRAGDTVAQLTAEDVEREINKGPSSEVCFIGSDTSKLADVQAALANSGGGRIFFGVQDQGLGRPGEIVGFRPDARVPVEYLLSASHPWAGKPRRPYAVKLHDQTIYIQDILRRAPDLYRGSTGFRTFNGVGLEPLEDRTAMQILRGRKGSSRSILPKPVPQLRRLSLEWLEFPFESELYNPEQRCLEWLDVRFNEDVGSPGSFTCELRTPVARAKELLDRKSISAEIDVEVGDVLLSSIPVRAYTALGFQTSPEWVTATRLRSELTISLEPILQRRTYYPVRSVPILGIEPRPERLREIIRILNDSGIIVDERSTSEFRRASIIRGVTLQGRKQGSLGTTIIYCHVAGTPSTVNRRLRLGQQIDDKQLTSGSMTLTFYVVTEESHGSVIGLLNEVVGNIHRRFDYLKVE